MEEKRIFVDLLIRIKDLAYEHVVSIYLHATIYEKLELKKTEFMLELRKLSLLSADVENTIKKCDDKTVLLYFILFS